MAKSKFEQNGGTYRKVGDYYIPNITVPPEEKDIRIGIWGMRYKNYLKENKRVINALKINDCKCCKYPTPD